MRSRRENLPDPWFRSEPHPAPGGRFLLLSYHFPPSTRIGARRWQEFSRFFSEAGWELDVITAAPAEDDQHVDPSLLEDLAPGLRLFTLPEREIFVRRLEDALHRTIKNRRGKGSLSAGAAPEAEEDDGESLSGGRSAVARKDLAWDLRRLRGWMRIYWSWSWRRQQLAWTSGAKRLGRRLLREDRYRAVICTGPPHVNHLAAGAIARRADLPFVMDMRDPWSDQPYMSEWVASPVTDWYDRRDEARAVRGASLVVANTSALEQELADRYPALADRLVTVRNGFDASEVTPAPVGSNGRFSVRYAGSIYYNRNPRPLFEGVSRLIERLGLGPEDFSLELIGHVDSAGPHDLRRLADEIGIADYVHLDGWQPREEAERFMSEAQVLVALPGDSDLGIPGKVYDYMRYPAWILALADEGSATDRLLEDTEAEVVPSQDADAVAEALRRLYESYRRDGPPRPLSRHPRFGRKAQAMKLLNAIEDRIGRPSDGRLADPRPAGRE